MNPQLTKEIRLLLPVWGATVLLVALPSAWVALLNPHREVMAYAITFDLMLLAAAFVLGLLLLAVSVVGREFSGRTFQFLLSQPIPRTQIWKRKMAVLGAASASLWLIFCVGLTVDAEFSWRTTLGSFVVAAAIVGTGLSATLLFRQILPAFAFSLLLPSLLVPIVSPMAASNFPTWIFLVALLLVAVYAVSMFRLSHRLFLGSQDLEPWLAHLSIDFVLGKESGDAWAAGKPRTNRRPLGSLIRKEIHLHQVNLICGTLLLVLLAGMQLLFGQGKQHGTEDGLTIGYVLATLFLPVLVGSAAIAEERKLGILTGQHCLPIAAARQFWIKVIVTGGAVLFLGVLFPVILTWVLLTLRGLNLGEGDAERRVLASAMGLWLENEDGMGVLFLVIYSVVAGTISLYASSLSRSAMGALVLALVFLFIGMFASLAIQEFWSGGPLLVLIGMSVGVLLLAFLAFRNFRHDLIEARVRRQNLTAVVCTGVAVVLATAFTHYRTWERILPEPALGPPEPLLADGAEVYPLPVLSKAFVHLPDGRLWLSDEFGTSHKTFSFPEHGHFLKEDNWQEVAARQYSVFGIRADGSLWRIFTPIPGDKPKGRLNVELFTSGRWMDIAASHSHALALRDDGTIWGWGPAGGFQVNQGRKSMRFETPRQIGSEIDWVAVHAIDGASLGVKQDGSLWIWNGTMNRPRQLDLPGEKVRSISGRWGITLAVMTDGSLWGWGNHPAFESPLHRLGERSDWKAADVVSWNAVAALRDDGTLWSKNFLPPVDHGDPPQLEPIERLSAHTRWIAIHASVHGLLALADDGSLWIWKDPDSYRESIETLILPSRWPTRVEQFVIE